MRVEWRFLLAGATILFAATWSSCSQSESATPSVQAQDEHPSTVVPAARVTRSTIVAKTVLTAEFQPFQEVDVMAKVAGYVRTINVDLGDRVRDGQILAELEVPEMTDEISKASAAIEQSSAEVAAARDELRRAESSHEIAHLSHSRLLQASQREPGLIPQQELDVVRSRDLIAEAQLASAASRLRVDQQRVSVAKAEETRLKTMRNYVTISAPFAGTVTRRYANLGSMIQAGIASQSQAMPLVRLSQLSTLRLSVPVPESLVPSIQTGRTVEVRVKSMDRNFSGRIARMASRVDTATRTMVAEVDVPNPGGILMPGMYAEVSIQSAQRDILSVPLETLDRAGTTARVYLIDQAGVIRVAPVQLGLEDALRAQILSGAAENDLVVTGRRTALKAGDKVTPKIQ
ncbi:MAG: efflux RND transporter periplasmic adaptor subunit [Bryobacterales bacterium]|nr:efflux RND transporter periplasmic adaptor subunit [Bryobacterales bacterium]